MVLSCTNVVCCRKMFGFTLPVCVRRAHRQANMNPRDGRVRNYLIFENDLGYADWFIERKKEYWLYPE